MCAGTGHDGETWIFETAVVVEPSTLNTISSFTVILPAIKGT
jgi:hypothetical protein